MSGKHTFTMVIPDLYYAKAEKIAALYGFNNTIDVFRSAIAAMLGEQIDSVDWPGVRSSCEERVSEIRHATTAYIWECRKARMKKDA